MRATVFIFAKYLEIIKFKLVRGGARKLGDKKVEKECELRIRNQCNNMKVDN